MGEPSLRLPLDSLQVRSPGPSFPRHVVWQPGQGEEGMAALNTEACQSNSAEVQKAEEYVQKHRIMELMNDLCASVCFHKPEDVRGFLLKELASRELEGAHRGFFDDQEVAAVFGLADLMKTGTISDRQARTALSALTNSQKQKEYVDTMDIAQEVDLTLFKQLARDALKADF